MVRQTFEKTIQNNGITVSQAEEGFNNTLQEVKSDRDNGFKNEWTEPLILLFDYAIDHNQGLFVSLHHNIEEDNVITSQNYFEKWIRRYVRERLQPSSEKKLKTYMEEDLALSARVAKVTGAVNEDLEKYSYGHAVYMSAENFNGAMLEEYISSVIEPIGWIWCAGSVYRAIDFCYLDYTDEEDNSVLLQIKNKYNTENSSSSAIRRGTTIEKWHRLNRPNKEDLSKPIPNWNELQSIIKRSTRVDKLETFEELDKAVDKLTEENYLQYIKENSNNDVDEL